MKLKIKNLIALSFLAFSIGANAQLKVKQLPETRNDIMTAAETSGEYFKYFDGSYADINGATGIGGSATYPLRYSIAIKLEKNNQEIAGKKISSITFILLDLSSINDVTVWISTNQPKNDRDANICCIPVSKESIVAGQPCTVKLPEAYLFGSSDVFVGYSFNETNPEDYPILVDKSQTTTKPNAFFLNYGMAWLDLKGSLNGNATIMVGLGEQQENITKGDVNNDGKINVLDLSATVDYIIKGKSSIVNKNAADVDSNGTVNIVDVESIVDIILERNKSFVALSGNESDMLHASATGSGLCIGHQAGVQYRGFQMDIVVPENEAIEEIIMDSDIEATHTMKYEYVGNGRYRVLVSSIDGGCFDTENLLSIVSSSDDMKIENIVFATPDLQEKRFYSINDGTTGISNAFSEKNTGKIFSINGTIADPNNLSSGIYIINNKKVVVK